MVAIEHPSEVSVISCRPAGQRAVLKFAAHTGATPIAGRFTPGAFTNQIQVLNFMKSTCNYLILFLQLMMIIFNTESILVAFFGLIFSDFISKKYNNK